MDCKTLVNGLVIAGVLCAGVTGSTSAADKTKPEIANKITAYVTAGPNQNQAVITLWMSNVNPVGAICLPFKFAAPDSFWLDSMVTRPYRAGSFQMMPPKYEKDKQTLLVNMLREADSVKAKTGLIPVGEGVLATLHFTAAGKFPLADFKLAAVQLPPENNLLYVTDTFNSVLPEFEVRYEAPPGVKGASKAEKTP